MSLTTTSKCVNKYQYNIYKYENNLQVNFFPQEILEEPVLLATSLGHHQCSSFRLA